MVQRAVCSGAGCLDIPEGTCVALRALPQAISFFPFSHYCEPVHYVGDEGKAYLSRL